MKWEMAGRKLNRFWDSRAQLSMVTQAKVAECSLTLGKVLPPASDGR